MPQPLTEESSFATLFPKYREAFVVKILWVLKCGRYLKEIWPQVETFFEEHGIACSLNLMEGSMMVRTTRKTWDPYAIIKARDLLKLLSRSVHFEQAKKIMQDDMNCDIIKVSGMVNNHDVFVKRRARLIGPNGVTLKAIEILTNCYVMVQGKTVVSMGNYKGLKTVRKIVEDCMKNIHPMYHIKTEMIKRELAKDESLKEENWDRFLPKFKKKNPPKKKKKSKSEKKDYTPFPPAQQPSKIDLQLESGEYFLSDAQKKLREKQERKRKETEKEAIKLSNQQKLYQPPKEQSYEEKQAAKESENKISTDESIERIKENMVCLI